MPDWRTLHLDDRIFSEPTADGHSLALWFPGKRDEAFQHWERVSTVPHTEFTVEPGITAVAAASVQAKQPIRGFFGKFLQRFQKPTEGRAWLLPTGDTAEQCGERRSDLILLWVEDKPKQLDEPWIKARWPECERSQKIGENLYLVFGIVPPTVSSTLEQAQASPRQTAERLLADARATGDRRREVSALTDLGITYLHEGSAQLALRSLDEALRNIRLLDERSEEGEIMGNLGLAVLRTGQPKPAMALLEQALTHARAANDQFAMKVSLERLGFAYAILRNPSRSLASFEEALSLARALADIRHEAELLWYLAIQHAEIGRREQAIASAQAAVEVMEKARNPQAAWYAQHLRRFRAGDSGIGLSTNEEAGPDSSPIAFLTSSLTASLWATPPAGMQGPAPPAGPGLLRMAVSAAKSMAKFLGSGLKTVPAATLQRRLRTCAACHHHTGLRCRLCGCFTNAKARIAHEQCPIAKWPE
jgi:tetratricopeptide (TPR) repeat protein